MRELLVVALAALMCGCVTPFPKEGTVRMAETQQVAEKAIQVGETTKKDVLDSLGPPDGILKGSEVPSANASDIWYYKSVSTSSYGSNVGLLVAGATTSTTLTEKSFLIIYFDDRGVVKEYTTQKRRS